VSEAGGATAFDRATELFKRTLISQEAFDAARTTLQAKKGCAGCGHEAEGSPKFCPECGQRY